MDLLTSSAMDLLTSSAKTGYPKSGALLRSSEFEQAVTGALVKQCVGDDLIIHQYGIGTNLSGGFGSLSPAPTSMKGLLINSQESGVVLGTNVQSIFDLTNVSLSQTVILTMAGVMTGGSDIVYNVPEVETLVFGECKVWSQVPHRATNRDKLDVLRTNAHQDWVPPTQYAYDRAIAILHECPGLPLAFVTTDSEGGIRMAWRRGGRQVRANFGGRAELKSYIYFQSPEQYSSCKLSGADLRDLMRWLNDER